jgi:hypothetical protein
MQATFGSDGKIAETGKGAHPGTAEGLGGANIKGVNDPKAKIDADQEGHDAGKEASKEPITTGRAPVGYDAGTGNVATAYEPEGGNTQNAAGGTTVALDKGNVLPTGK